MPYIEARKNKEGKVTSYKLVVSCGFSGEGKRIRHQTIWVPPSAAMTERQMTKEATAAAYKLEEQLAQGYIVDDRKTFAEYAEYAISLKEEMGVKPTTIDRYRELLVRINEHIGNLPLNKIRPQHLNEFYTYLMEHGNRLDADRAVSKRALKVTLNEMGLSKRKLSQESGLAASTITNAVRGDPITIPSAKAISHALEMDFDDLFKEQEKTVPLAPKTILEHHRLISTIFSLAEKEMLVPYNPAARATPPKAKRPKPDYYQPDEMDDILEALESAPLKWKTITYLMIDTGCRRGEAMGLKWSSVNLETGLIVIESALLYTKSKGTYEGDTKTDKTRAMYLASETLTLLRQWHDAQQELKRLNGNRWLETGFVFTRDNGEHMNPDSITDWLSKFSEKMNLPHIHPHAFRHTAASTMIANGADLVSTAAELGHANATTTATIYAHQIAIARAKAANARAGVFSNRNKNSKSKKRA